MHVLVQWEDGDDAEALEDPFTQPMQGLEGHNLHGHLGYPSGSRKEGLKVEMWCHKNMPGSSGRKLEKSWEKIPALCVQANSSIRCGLR